MRFKESDYLKAFPRSEKPTPVKVITEPGNVVEEAEQIREEPKQIIKEDPQPIQPGDIQEGGTEDGAE